MNEIYPTVVGNNADDTDVIQDAVDQSAITGGEVVLPPGVFRITRPIVRTAPPTGMFSVARGAITLQYSPGLKIRGASMLTTKLLADYNGAGLGSAMLRMDTATPRSYLMECSVSHLGFIQAPGRTGINAIELTAAWMTDVHHVMGFGLSGNGIGATWRNDISVNLSDPYQAHQVRMEQNYFEALGGRGLSLAAGQSPGIYAARNNLIRRCAGGGIYTTTGQSEIIGNNIQDCGTYGVANTGGLIYDEQEGPSFVPRIELNEFDDNFNCHIQLHRIRSGIVRQNRFLSGTFESTTSFTRLADSAFIRPGIHVKFGNGIGGEVWRTLCEMNYHRTIGGSNTTTPVTAYQAAANVMMFKNRILNNDMSYADGHTQNSLGLIETAGFTGSDTEISNPQPVVIGSVHLMRAHIAQATTVYAGANMMAVEVTDLNANGAWASPYALTAPAAGSYTCEANFRLNGMAAGEQVTVDFRNPGNTSQIYGGDTITATGAAAQDFHSLKTFPLSSGQRVSVFVSPAAQRTLNVSDPTFNWFDVVKN